MELGKKIRQLRFKAGMTQEQLAERLGIAPQSVSKWENAVAMPDITLLPMLAEVFGISIDDLFDLTVEQRLNRIENRMDVEEELPQDIFMEYEEFLKTQMNDEKYKKRATELIAYLYWHRMNAAAQQVRRYAKEAIRRTPEEKGCQWMLMDAEKDAGWDWNMNNHSAAIEFYGELVKEKPDNRMSYYYLLDNLIADHRTAEAEQVLEKMSKLEGVTPMVVLSYRAGIALARFDEPAADRIMEDLAAQFPEDSIALFEVAQYHAKKCDYQKAIEYYELSFEKEKRRPRFTDELMGIADIHKIMGDYQKAAETWDRIIDLLQTEWHMTEETELKNAMKTKAQLLEKAQK